MIVFLDKPMPPNHRCIIQKKTHELQSDILDVYYIIPYLQKYVPMSPYLIEYVYAPVMRSDRIRRMLDSLVTVGEKALPVFIKALSESKHEHLADSLQGMEFTNISLRNNRDNFKLICPCKTASCGHEQRLAIYNLPKTKFNK